MCLHHERLLNESINLSDSNRSPQGLIEEMSSRRIRLLTRQLANHSVGHNYKNLIVYDAL